VDVSQVLPGALLLLGISFAFFVSASAGLGGSLVLVPVLTLALGAKEGISLAALLLAGNNLVKLWAYRQVLPLRAAAVVTLCTFVGALLGSWLLVAAPVALAEAAVVISFAMALVVERRASKAWRLSLVPGLAVAAGATSGFSGTSGPLKGVAVRSLGLDRMHTIGAAAIVSAVADLTKAAVYAEAGLLGGVQLQLALIAIPLMIAATFAGRHFTVLIGEVGYARLFWLVIGGYAVRLMF
jgi:uncharacterized protein